MRMSLDENSMERMLSWRWMSDSNKRGENLRGRPKKYSIDRTRLATIKLTGTASVILGEIRNKSKAFNFSKYVSNKLIQDFYDVNKERILLHELQMIQQEQDIMNQKFENMKRGIAIRLGNIRDEKQMRV